MSLLSATSRVIIGTSEPRLASDSSWSAGVGVAADHGGEYADAQAAVANHEALGGEALEEPLHGAVCGLGAS